MDGKVGYGSWVMFVDAGGRITEGRAVSDPEELFGALPVVWVDVVGEDGSTVTTPVPANEVRPVERLGPVGRPPADGEHQAQAGPDGRLGERTAVAPVPAHVVVDRGRWRRTRRLEVTITDISVTGAGVTGVLPDDRPRVLPFEINGITTHVRVKHTKVADGGLSYYGLEFIDATPELHRELDHLVRRDTLDEEAWHSRRI